jgi:hypothetical protein
MNKTSYSAAIRQMLETFPGSKLGVGRVSEQRLSSPEWSFARYAKMITNPEEADNFYRDSIRQCHEEGKKDLILYMSNHGMPGSTDNNYDPKNVMQGGPQLQQGVYRNEGLLATLQASQKENQKIKLIGMHCFSGGLQEVVFRLPNSCATSVANWRVMGRSREKMRDGVDDSPFTLGIHEEKKDRAIDLNRDGKTSMFESYLRSITNIERNIDQTEISSFAFVKNKLKAHPYKSPYEPSELESLNFAVELGIPLDKLKDQVRQAAKQRQLFLNHLFPDCTERTSSSLSEFSSLMTNLDRTVVDSESFRLTEMELNSLPPVMKSRYLAMIENPFIREKLEAASKTDFNQLSEEFIGLIEKEATLMARKEKDVDSNGFKTTLGDDDHFLKEHERILKRKTELMKSMNLPVFGIMAQVRSFKQTAHFMKNASELDKQKLNNILSCEEDPL